MNLKQSVIPSEEFREEVARLGQAKYEKLKSELERDFPGKYVVIHVDNGDYRVGDSTSKATRDIEKVHPIDGRLYMRRIGDEPEYELAARILASDMIAAGRK